MAKKATDLLDVFRLGSAENASRAARSSASRKRKPSKRRSGPPEEGIQLGGRQLLLASCIGVLLIVLAFTVGLGVGRRGVMDTGPSLSRGTPASNVYWIRGTLPTHDHVMNGPVIPGEVVRELYEWHKIHPDRVRISLGPKKSLLQIDVGPFPTAAAAEAFHKDQNMKVIRLRHGSPFRFESVLAEPRRP